MEPTQPFNSPEQRELSRAFGIRFREARESAGWSVVALAHSTRISVGFIEALESGAFERLPGEVFGRGFVRSICKALNLDAKEIIAGFDECWDRSTLRKSVLEVEIKEKPFGPGILSTLIERIWLLLRIHPKMIAGLSTSVAATIVGVTVWYTGAWHNWSWLTKGVAEKTVTATQLHQHPMIDAPYTSLDSLVATLMSLSQKHSEPAQVSERTHFQIVTSSVPDVPASTGLKDGEPTAFAMTREGAGEQVLELVVIDSVRIRADVDAFGARVKEYPPGSHQIRFKDKVEMMIYDAAAVNMSFNGRPLGPLGAKGRVRRLSFQATAADHKQL